MRKLIPCAAAALVFCFLSYGQRNERGRGPERGGGGHAPNRDRSGIRAAIRKRPTYTRTMKGWAIPAMTMRAFTSRIPPNTATFPEPLGAIIPTTWRVAVPIASSLMAGTQGCAL